MICDNCFIMHTPEDCIINGYVSYCSTDTVDLISLSDDENSNDAVIFIPDDNDYGGLHTIPKAEGAGS